MTEAAEAEAPPVEDIDPNAPAADVAADQAPTEPDPEVIAKAAKLGWTPKEQFKGDPEKWVDADAFVKRGEELMPLLRAHNRKLERKVADLEGTLEKFGKFAEQAEKRAYDRAVRDLKAELAQAVEAGDHAAAADVAERMSELKTEIKAVPEPKEAQNEAFDDWVEENPWFKTDRALKGAAIEIAQELAESGLIDPAKQLAEVSKRIRAEFPHKFAAPANPRRTSPAAVEGAPASGQRQSGNTYSDLPPEAKKLCDEFVRDIPGFTREKFVKDFDFKGYAR